MKDAGYELAVFAGDGTGPEVVREGVKILNVLAEGGPAPWRATEYPGGGQVLPQDWSGVGPRGRSGGPPRRRDPARCGRLAGGDPPERRHRRPGTRPRPPGVPRPVRERPTVPPLPGSEAPDQRRVPRGVVSEERRHGDRAREHRGPLHPACGAASRAAERRRSRSTHGSSPGRGRSAWSATRSSCARAAVPGRAGGRGPRASRASTRRT